jgi:uncharacterized protein YaaN involved in tellurite resistance
VDRRPLAESQRDLRRLVERQLKLAEARSMSAVELGRASAAIEARLRVLIAAIEAEREVLEIENGLLNQQERALWSQVLAIRECVTIAARIDERLHARIEAIPPDDARLAKRLRDEVLYSTRLRRRDLLLQLAVATQGYAALRRIEQGNLELIWLIRGTTTTTATALRTALLATHAVSNRGADVGVGEIRDAWRDVIGVLDDVERRRRGTLDAVREADARSA